MITQLPITMNASHKSDVRGQFAALCYRLNKKGKPKILLVTSRGSGRWVMPKGWPIDGKTPAASAAQEAWEEAGVRGIPVDQCLGLYSYRKWRSGEKPLPCMVMVYPLAVTELDKKFPEREQRRRKWFSPQKAARLVNEPELARILQDFHPRVLHR